MSERSKGEQIINTVMIVAVIAMVVAIVISILLPADPKATENDPEEFREVTYTDVVKVFWHEHNRYTILRETSPGVHEMWHLPYHRCRNAPYAQLITDVPTGGAPWVYVKGQDRRVLNENRDFYYESCFYNLEIHLPDVSHLGTGDWNHGKFGSGSTVDLTPESD